jgi:Xaa-Pro aminopeptidase
MGRIDIAKGARMTHFKSLFQSFEDPASYPGSSAKRLDALRQRLTHLGVDGFMVPRTDAHMNEYIPASEERLMWLTGFSGSAGTAIVLPDQAAIFIDGRYTVQVRGQVDAALFKPIDTGVTPLVLWLEISLTKGMRLGFDPWLHTPNDVARVQAACDKAGAELVALDINPIDGLWADRPCAPQAPVCLHDERFAGAKATEKIKHVQHALAQAGTDALVLSDAHSIAWLFNIRGGDVAHTPLPLSFAIVHARSKPILFVEPAKISNNVGAVLGDVADMQAVNAFAMQLTQLGGSSVWLDPAANAFHVLDVLERNGARLHKEEDPILLMKAIKSEAEIKGAREAHLRDGVAMCRFLAWLDAMILREPVTEIQAAEALETFRRETGALKDVSFPSISASGPHAALPHYRVTYASNRVLDQGFYLIDSGAQYEDGTTDITRTLVIGEASIEMRDRFTRVLQGHIGVASCTFPKGSTGAQLDPFARRPLWDTGADFDHGTGHGVGSYLSVHEGPQRISRIGHTRLEPGMILSNEPGYYKEGHYGIRLENLVLVRDVHLEGAERAMLGLENLTLAPFDRRGIIVGHLSAAERQWLNDYHARVMAFIAPAVDISTRQWLEHACRAV